MGCHLTVRIHPDEQHSLYGFNPKIMGDNHPYKSHYHCKSHYNTMKRQDSAARLRHYPTLMRSTVQASVVPIPPPMPPRQTKSGKFALIVAVNMYIQWPTLKTATYDASTLKGVLQARGFTVVLLSDDRATRQNIVKELNNIPAVEVALVAFLGHGCVGTNGAAFIPIEANENSHDITDKISVNILRGVSRRMRAHSCVFLLDCCFGGDFLNTPDNNFPMRGKRPSWSYRQKEPSRIVLSASLKNEQVPDADSSNTSHSPFMAAILECMEQPEWNGSLLELFVNVRRLATAAEDPSIVPKVGRFPGDEGGDAFL